MDFEPGTFNSEQAERSSAFLSILRQYWGYTAFRGIQAEIIESIAAGHDTLGLMPTGGGKSITFQVPALASEGMCLVVTPLIALMKDQVENLRKRGITAAAIHSGQTRSEVVRHLDNAIFGAYKFLYVSPERLSTSLFLNKVSRMKVCLITVDEAHCISQWGYDFRPHYLRIAEVRRKLPDTPVLALTATATATVVEDICRRLEFRDGKIFRMSFARPNLRYVVRQVDGKAEEILHILQSVPGSAIVYTRSRKGTREIVELLRQAGISAHYYHAGLTSLDKDARQHAWQDDDVRVMVATNAFGMGIDKPDVRIVIHADVPDSIEAYFQEAGRGGRDGQTSYAVLLYDKYDAMRLHSRIPQMFPERDYIRQVYTDLASFFQIAVGEAEGRTFEFDINRFCRTFKHFPVTLVSALNLLTRAGYIHFSIEDENSSRVIFLVRRDELYQINYMSNDEEAVLYALMRSEGGFFTDYMPIEENRIGESCKMSADEVYQNLRSLTQKRILNYIPHKDTPQITYTMRRIETQYVEILPEIYEKRRDQYKSRIDAMVNYFLETEVCRSRYLLHYFGDEGADCGHCDICLGQVQRDKTPTEEEQTEQAARQILRIIADGKPHSADELQGADFTREITGKAIRLLIEEEQIEMDGSLIRIRQT